LRRGSSRIRPGSGSSPYCRRWSGASAFRVASAFLTGRRCRGFCSSCTHGSPGGICRSSSASARARPATGALKSGSGPGLGEAAPAPALRAAGGGRARVGARLLRLEPCASENGGSETGPSPVDRARNGSKHRLLVDATGIWTATGGNRNDVTQLIPPLDKVPPGRGAVGRPRCRPDAVVADDHDAHRRLVRARGVKPVIARRKTEHGSGLGRVRWVVERPSLTFTTSSGWSSASTVAPRSMTPSSLSPAASSASEAWKLV
jgi:transposase